MLDEGVLLDALQHMTGGQIALLLLCLGLAFTFELINGFHDTANAVATVIYTRSLRPTPAVIWSGLCNMLGIFLGGIGVAFSIVHLLPLDMLVNINTGSGLAMMLAILIAAITWNFGTWFVGLPSSSSHALIGGILGVGLMNGVLNGQGPIHGVNVTKMSEVGLSLLLSPLIGFGFSALMLLLAKRLSRSGQLNRSPGPGDRPPWWIRGTLIGTCTGVSLAHGSNDGQKGMGIVMLILIGLAPMQFALNMEGSDRCVAVRQATERLETFVTSELARNELAARAVPGVAWAPVAVPSSSETGWLEETRGMTRKIRAQLYGHHSFEELSAESRWELRQWLVKLERTLRGVEKRVKDIWPAPRLVLLKSVRKEVRNAIEYVPRWVVLCIALALGLGTMVGWRRIVVTVGEKIGKTHLTYGQGASAELVAMTTIGLADVAGLPVSTTHVLSSGVAGTMWANRSGVNGRTIRSIALAWIMTLPASMALAAGLLWILRSVLG